MIEVMQPVVGGHQERMRGQLAALALPEVGRDGCVLTPQHKSSLTWQPGAMQNVHVFSSPTIAVNYWLLAFFSGLGLWPFVPDLAAFS